jgi:hypothetical protein
MAWLRNFVIFLRSSKLISRIRSSSSFSFPHSKTTLPRGGTDSELFRASLNKPRMNDVMNK